MINRTKASRNVISILNYVEFSLNVLPHCVSSYVTPKKLSLKVDHVKDERNCWPEMVTNDAQM